MGAHSSLDHSKSQQTCVVFGRVTLIRGRGGDYSVAEFYRHLLVWVVAMKTSAGNTATDRLCVAIIDAQPLFRAGVAAALRGCENVDLIAEGDSAAEALRAKKAG